MPVSYEDQHTSKAGGDLNPAVRLTGTADFTSLCSLVIGKNRSVCKSRKLMFENVGAVPRKIDTIIRYG